MGSLTLVFCAPYGFGFKYRVVLARMGSTSNRETCPTVYRLGDKRGAI